MIVSITQTSVEEHDVPYTFPLYRRERIARVYQDDYVYWKFESHHKVTRIEDRISEMSILSHEDEKADFVKEMITSVDMLHGRYQYAIIPESLFDATLQRLIDLIHRC